MDEKQIVFITCVNDEEEYGECCYYLDRLNVPEGYRMDRICVKEAPSMAAGYNAAMNSSDAKYKVYLHQDVMIRNRNFIPDLLTAFARDRKIGMLGMVGNRIMWKDMMELMYWDTGKVEDSYKPYPFRFPSREDGFLEVRMADGLLLATQYDLRWREDIFDNWHFYDLAQCMEFRAAGYKVAIPWQESAWCYHDCAAPVMNSYFDYYERFVREYGQRADFPVEHKEVILSAYRENQKESQLLKRLKLTLEESFNTGNKAALRSFFEEPDVSEVQCLWEYESIVRIDCQEEAHQSLIRLWSPGMTLPQLLCRFRALRHALKRIQWGAQDGQERDWILANYSAYAVEELGSRYFSER